MAAQKNFVHETLTQEILVEGKPVDADEFAALMDALGPFPADDPRFPVGIAVSGGADSLCLAWLMRRWRRAVLAFVVDHGLREASAAEAVLTRSRLKALDIPAVILRLGAIDKTRSLQKSAREARYQAMQQACAAHGILDLALGHHARDQAETYYLRKTHGSTSYGLASMALVRETPGLRYLRPLLQIAPERLRATLTRHAIPWVEDPSNQNRAFERVRIRQTLTPSSCHEGLTLAGRYGRLRNESRTVWGRALAGLYVDPAGFAIMEALPDDPALLGRLWQMMAGSAYPPSPALLARLIKAPAPATLAGGMLCPAGRLGRGWLLAREASAIRARCAATDGVLWDRRFRMTGDAPESDLIIAALGAESRHFRHHDLPARVLSTLPGLWRGQKLVAVPTLGEGMSCRWRGVSLSFLPETSASDLSFWPECPQTMKT